MSRHVKPPPQLDQELSYIEYRHWEEQWDHFFMLSGVHSASLEVQKKSLFSHFNLSMQDLVWYTLGLRTYGAETMNELLTAIRKYFRGKTNVVLDRIKFSSRVQAHNENFDLFVADVRRLHSLAEFCEHCLLYTSPSPRDRG